MNIVIGMPAGETIYANTYICMIELVRQTTLAGHKLTLLVPQASVPSQNQNKIITDALADPDTGAVMLIDSDMIFPGDTILRLLAHDLPHVGAIYRIRKPPFNLAFIPLDEKPMRRDITGLVEARHIPSGMSLIRRPVLEAVGYPWMEEEYGETFADLVGHDVNFCYKSRAKGFGAWADMDLSREVYHQAVIPIGLENGP